jgi:hypothetical protein
MMQVLKLLRKRVNPVLPFLTQIAPGVSEKQLPG